MYYEKNYLSKFFAFLRLFRQVVSAFATHEYPEPIAPSDVEVEAPEALDEILKAINHTAAYLSGDNVTAENTTVEYTVSVTNVEKFATATVWFEVDGSSLE